jgi:hypothetical protein
MIGRCQARRDRDRNKTQIGYHSVPTTGEPRLPESQATRGKALPDAQPSSRTVENPLYGMIGGRWKRRHHCKPAARTRRALLPVQPVCWRGPFYPPTAMHPQLRGKRVIVAWRVKPICGSGLLRTVPSFCGAALIQSANRIIL